MGCRKDGMPVNNLAVMTSIKGHFLNLAKMYSQLGQYFVPLAKVLSHNQFSRTPAPETMQKILDQYREIAEEMKTVGTYIDFLPGEKIMRPAEPKPDLEFEKKEELKKEKTTKKKAMKKKEYVSNIKPTKKKKENKK